MFPPIAAAPRAVSFTAPCPQCGTATTWSQEFGERVQPEHFTIACDCTVAA